MGRLHQHVQAPLIFRMDAPPQSLDIEMKRTVAALAFLATLSVAQAQERQFTLTIPESHLNTIGKAMGRQPYEDARPIIDGIQAQVNAQLAREANAARDAERERIKSELTKEDIKP